MLTQHEVARLNGAIDYLEKNGFHEPAKSIRVLLGRAPSERESKPGPGVADVVEVHNRLNGPSEREKACQEILAKVGAEKAYWREQDKGGNTYPTELVRFLKEIDPLLAALGDA